MHVIPGFVIIPGVTYVMYPVKFDPPTGKEKFGKTKYAPVPMYKDKLEAHPELIETIIQALEIYIGTGNTDSQGIALQK